MQFIEFSYRSSRYLEMLPLRDLVLRAPLGMHLSEADVDGEAAQRHFGLMSGNDLIAGCIAKPLTPGLWQLRQMVVHPDHQRRGFGARLLAEVETLLASEGAVSIQLDARQSVAAFYAAAGYVPMGGPFSLISLPHQRMQKRLAIG